jgi:hypothetical protein
MNIEKYPRTYHFPFSLGKSSDDKVIFNWGEALREKSLIYTEKLDGGNTQICQEGVFARSVSTPTNHPSFDHLKAKWASVKYDLKDLYIFGENMFAVHSLEYSNLDSYFYIFGVKERIWENAFQSKCHYKWYSWQDVCEIAEWLGYPTVPRLEPNPEKSIQQNIEEFMNMDSVLGGPKEGIVVRNTNSFYDEDFSKNVIKYVRANHVQTDQHWSTNWKQAKLNYGKY